MTRVISVVVCKNGILVMMARAWRNVYTVLVELTLPGNIFEFKPSI